MCAGGSIPSWTAKYPIVNPPMGKSKDSFSSEANAEIADWPFQTSRSCHFTLSVIPLGFQLHGGCPDSERSVAEQLSESSLLELVHANPDGFFLKGVAAASLIVIREKKNPVNNLQKAELFLFCILSPPGTCDCLCISGFQVAKG